MRRVVGVVAGTAVAAAGLLLTACGSSSGNGSTGNQAQASPPEIVSAAYAKTTSAKTAKAQISTDISAARQSVPVTASGTIDFSGPSADLTEHLPQGAGNLEVRYLNGFIYEQLPPAIAQQIGATKPWISIDANKIAQQKYGASLSMLQSSTPGNPSDQLSYLRGASDHVTTVGKETVDGAQTTHYTMTLDLDKATNSSPQAKQAVAKLEQQLGTHTLPAQAWIDDQGRVRKLTLTETMAHPPTGSNGQQTGPITIHLTEMLSDFGTAVNVAAPPADQTTDLTNQLLNQSH